MKDTDTIVYTLPLNFIPAIVWARLFYRLHGDYDFDKDLEDYMLHGFVCVRPQLFAMARPVIYKEELVWFCRIAVGDILEIASVLPCHLPKIIFCRRGEKDKIRIYSIDRILKLLEKKRGNDVSKTMQVQ